MNKYEEAKVQVKAQEIAEKVSAMSEKDYQKFIKKLQAEINVINAGIEVTQDKLHKLEKKPIKKMAESDGALIVSVAGVTSAIGAVVACANRLSPMDFVDTLIMGTSALGSAGIGFIGGALASAILESNPVGQGIRGIQKHIQKKKLGKLNDELFEKDLIMDEVCETVMSREV